MNKCKKCGKSIRKGIKKCDSCKQRASDKRKKIGGYVAAFAGIALSILIGKTNSNNG